MLIDDLALLHGFPVEDAWTQQEPQVPEEPLAARGCSRPCFTENCFGLNRLLNLYTVAGAVMVTTLETPGPGVKLLTLAFLAMTAIVSPSRTLEVVPSWNCTELGMKF
jgi:hypothetical protein